MSLSSLALKAAKTSMLPLGLAGGRRDGDAVILLYHRVGAGGREVDLSAGAFERQMAALAKGGQARSLDAALEEGSGGVVVTFDDGYRDFYDHALPLLRCYRIPALLYLQTGLVAEERAGRCSGEHLSWSHLQEATATGLVTVGAHTHTHPDLSRTPEPEAEEEMRRCRELIEDRLGLACPHFAYPFAVASAGAERAARRLFSTAAIGVWKINRCGRVDPYRLGRTPVLRSDGGWLFAAKMQGRLNGEALLYRAFGRGPWRHI